MVYCYGLFSHMDLTAYLLFRGTCLVATAGIESLPTDINDLHASTKLGLKLFKVSPKIPKKKRKDAYSSRPEAERRLSLRSSVRTHNTALWIRK